MEAQTAISFGASAIGLVAKMPSGQGVISDDQIAKIAKTIPPPVAIINKRYKPQVRALDPFSGASPGELTIVPIPRPLPCWQGRGAGEGYVKKAFIPEISVLVGIFLLKVYIT